MSSAKRVLFVATSQHTIGDSDEPTGIWFEELSTPYYLFVDAGYQVDITSTRGGKVSIDPRSLAEPKHLPASVQRFQNDGAAMAMLNDSGRVADARAANYQAVFLPGGHGAMWDMPESDALASLLTEAWSLGQVVAGVCHGPAGLVNARQANGDALVKGKRVAGFSNTEEAKAHRDDAVPFLLESRLRELGGRYECGPDFRPFAVRDGKLVTGQNPASSELTATLALEALTDTNA